jgi:hypothetical protein
MNRRDIYHPTADRGLSYQFRKDGSKALYGYVPALGKRVKLESSKYREARPGGSALRQGHQGRACDCAFEASLPRGRE